MMMHHTSVSGDAGGPQWARSLRDCGEYQKFVALLRAEEARDDVTKERLETWVAKAPVDWECIKRCASRSQDWRVDSQWKRKILKESVQRQFKMGRPRRVPVPERARITIEAGVQRQLSAVQLRCWTQEAHPQYPEAIVKQWVDQMLEERGGEKDVDPADVSPSLPPDTVSTVLDLNDLEQMSHAPPTVASHRVPFDPTQEPPPTGHEICVSRAREMAQVEVARHTAMVRLDVERIRAETERARAETERALTVAQGQRALLEVERERFAAQTQARQAELDAEERSLDLLERRQRLKRSHTGAPKQAVAGPKPMLREVVTSDQHGSFRGLENLTARVLRRLAYLEERDTEDETTRRRCDALAEWFQARRVTTRWGAHRGCIALRTAQPRTGNTALVYRRAGVAAVGEPLEVALAGWLRLGADPAGQPPHPLDLNAVRLAVPVLPEVVRDGCDAARAWRALRAAYPILASYQDRWQGSRSPLARAAPPEAVRGWGDLWAAGRTHASLAELRGGLAWPAGLASDAGVVVRLAKRLHREVPWSDWVEGAGSAASHGYRPEAVPHLAEAALLVHGFQLGLPTEGRVGHDLTSLWRLMHLV